MAHFLKDLLTMRRDIRSRVWVAMLTGVKQAMRPWGFLMMSNWKLYSLSSVRYLATSCQIKIKISSGRSLNIGCWGPAGEVMSCVELWQLMMSPGSGVSWMVERCRERDRL